MYQDAFPGDYSGRHARGMDEYSTTRQIPRLYPQVPDARWPGEPSYDRSVDRTFDFSDPPRPPRRGRGRMLAAVAVVTAALLGGVAGAAGMRVLDQQAPGVIPAAAGAPAADNAPTRADLTGIASRVQRSVVSIEVRRAGSRSTGSGFVIDRQGHILTNAHVVSGGLRVTVITSDRRQRQARVVGLDADNDVAVLDVGSAGLPVLPMGRSSQVRVGQWVLAFGSPLGLAGTVTSGIISALDREVSVGQGNTLQAVQTDASINPGNSGGPLVNTQGQVIGVNTAIATLGNNSSGSIGIGFAIPIDRAMTLATQLLR